MKKKNYCPLSLNRLSWTVVHIHQLDIFSTAPWLAPGVHIQQSIEPATPIRLFVPSALSQFLNAIPANTALHLHPTCAPSTRCRQRQSARPHNKCRRAANHAGAKADPQAGLQQEDGGEYGFYQVWDVVGGAKFENEC